MTKVTNNGSKQYQKAVSVVCGMLVTMPQIVMGANTATVTVKVTVVAPPCIINNNNVITVEFGDVITTQVDGSNYRFPVNYTLVCKGATTNAMRLQVQGVGASFDGTVLQTSKADLGIKLIRGSSQLAINSWLNFNYPLKPYLAAIPVKRPGTTLTGGEFTAGATLKVDYL
ncbi:type 1 fimbria pilin [Rahnella inusitata]|nr:type 1 fimbria pilin [Rahnella inusitata]